MTARTRLMVAVGAAVVMTVSSCSDPKPLDETPNPFLMGDWVLDNATSVVLADVVSIEPHDNDTETVTLRPIVTFAGDVEVGDDGTLSFTRPADERDDTHRGFWFFDEAGDLMSTTHEEEAQDAAFDYPWYQSAYEHRIFERYPFAVRARDVLAAAPIVILGQVPSGTRQSGDEVLTIRVARMLRGELDVEPPAEIEVAMGDVAVASPFDDNVWLIEPTADGSLRLFDTWITAPWEWSMPALGEALREAFPEDAPATTAA